MMITTGGMQLAIDNLTDENKTAILKFTLLLSIFNASYSCQYVYDEIVYF